MLFKEVITLITLSYSSDQIGNQIPTENKREIFANQFSVTQSEFYNASQSHLKPEKTFQMYSFEYENETELEHEGKRYYIIRVETKGDYSKLVCERKIGDG